MYLVSRVVPLPEENVDTDQIIPARYLKTTVKNGLGQALMYDWRYDAAGKPRPDFVLNRQEFAGAEILLAGANFGCGSSREHAPWALSDYGFRALISTSFADIFRNNCLKNGLLPVIVDRDTHAALFSLSAENPAATVAIDLEAQSLTLQNGATVRFPIDPFSKKCLLEGIDELGYILRHASRISDFERNHYAAHMEPE